MKKRFYCGLIIFLTLAMTLLLTGCNSVLFPTKKVPSQNLVITTGRDCIAYEYKEKVIVYYEYEVSKLVVKNTSYNEWEYEEEHEILKGKFDLLGWYDDILCIKMDEKYYIFDIDAYDVSDLYNEIVLEEYDLESLEEKYPNFKELFYWRKLN